MIPKTLSLLLFALAGTAATSALAADFTGKWEGNVSGPEADFKLGYTITRTGDAFSGVIDAGTYGTFPMEDLKIEGDTISFRVSSEGGTWTHEGRLQDDTINVMARGPDADFPLVMKRVPPNVAGRWQAKIEGPDGAMDLTFEFTVMDGKVGGTVHSSFGDSPIVSGSLEGNTVIWETEWEGGRINHVGKISKDTMEVQVTAPDFEFPMTLKRAALPDG